MMRKNATFNLLKRGKTWYALIYDPERHPAQIQRTLRTREKSIARRKLVDWERDYVDGRFDPWSKKKRASGNITVREAVKKFRDEQRPHSAETTLSTRGSRLHAFADWIDDGTPIKAVQPHHIEDFFAQLTGRYNDEPSIHTLAVYYGTLSTLFSWAVKQGHMVAADNPINNVERPRAPDDDFTIVSVPEFVRIRETILADTRPSAPGESRNRHQKRRYMVGVIDMAVTSMLRISELCSLRWSQIRLREADCTAYVRVQNYAADQVEDGVGAYSTKTRTSKRTIFLAPRGAYVLFHLRQQYINEHGHEPPPERIVFRSARGNPLITQTPSKLWKEYVEMADIGRRVRFHDLRHTGISWLLNDLDVPLVHVQEMAGHATANRTMKYRRGGERSMRDAYKRAAGMQEEQGSQSEVRRFLWCEDPYTIEHCKIDVAIEMP